MNARSLVSKSSMGRGRRRRQCHSHQIDEKWFLESLPDQNTEKVNTNHPPDLENPSSSLAAASIPLNEPTTIVPISQFIEKTSNTVWGWPNRRSRTSKHRFVNAGPRNSSSAHRRKEGDEVINELGSVKDSEQDKVGEEKVGDQVLELENDLNGETIKGPDSVQGDYVGRRLEQLQLGVAESDLSAEESRINDQLQEDELIAMESIYGDNLFILDKQRGLHSFQIHIHAETSSELNIAVKLNSSSNLETKSDGSDEFSYSFKVQYLPPIVLTCVLPKSYPSHISPYFTVSVQWLDSGKISNLCCMLDSLWSEQPGQEVIYRWVEWLQSSCLSYLGFDKEIVLGYYGLRYSGDRRAISGSISPDVDIPLLRNYDDQQRQENFCRNLHECCICISEFAGSEFVRLPCEHFFCWKCVKIFSDMHVKEGTINKLQCPNAQCGGMIPPRILKLLLGDEGFERWESLMLHKTLESMSDVVYCPRCETACIEDEDQHTQCSKCFFSFCTLCWEQRHVGTACMTPELKLAILKERQNSSQLKDVQKRREQEMINEILSVREILRDAKQCPSCKMAISRIEGCNKMVCNNCGQYFCYRCNQAIDGYDHFRDGACDLFPQEAIKMWEERMMNARQVVGQIQAQLFADRGHPCPTCGQNNVKVGNNNHIFCWQCQSHYCYLCRKTVRRSSQHYGPKGCKQHSVG